MQKDSTVIVLRALADEARLSIVRKLAMEHRSVSSCDIVSSCASFMRLSQPTISHHFHKLVEAGVLIETKDGVAKRYQLDRKLLATVGINTHKL